MSRFRALSALVLGGVSVALAQATVTPPPRPITVTGTAQIQATPTLALVVVAVQTQAETLSAAVEANNTAANRVDSIQFSLEDMTMANNQALAQAVNNARSTVRAVAAAAGVQVVALQSLTTQPFYSPVPYLARAELAASAPPIIAGQLTIQATVTAVYTIR